MTATNLISSPLTERRSVARFGVAFRLLSAFAAITVFAIATSVIALYTFGKYGDGFNRIASSNVPALVAASNLAQRSQALAANAPNLAVADGHFARRAVSEALRGQLQAIVEASEQVKVLAPATEGLESLIQNQASLGGKLKILDALVAEKLEADRVAANLMLRLRTLSVRIQAAGSNLLSKIIGEQASRAQIDAPSAWIAAADQAIVIMLSTSSADTTIRLNQLRSEFEDVRNRAETARGQLLPALIEEVDPLEQTLVQYGRGSPNIFDVRTAQLASASAVRGALLDTKEAAAQFVASAERIFTDIQRDVSSQSDFFGRLISEYSRLFTIMSLLCVAGACGVFLYVNRSVIQRLRKLSQNMRASVDGHTAAISISGNDEIADMAKAADFFVTSIEQREQGLRESLQQQTATADVLKVISRSTFNLQTVLDTLVESAVRLCEGYDAVMFLRERESLVFGAHHGPIPIDFKKWAITRNWTAGRAVIDAKPVHVHDLTTAGEEFPEGHAMAKRLGHRTILSVPLLRENEAIGSLTVRRTEVKPFTDKQIELITTFADQAVIAIENVRLFDEVRARTRELAQSVEELRALGEVTQAVNSTVDLETVLTTIVAKATQLSNTEAGAIYVFEEAHQEFRLRATYGMDERIIAEIRDRHMHIGETAIGKAAEQRMPVQIADIQNDPSSPVLDVIVRAGFRALLVVPLLGADRIVGALVVRRKQPGEFPKSTIELLQTFAAQSVLAIQNARLFESVETRTRELAKSLQDLRTTQDRLVQTEKLASLGQLTAGIAHEIKNPLNFVNNFSGVSAELIDELQDTLKGIHFDDKARAEINDLTNTLRGNLDKVVQHGKRADAIVKNMLLHSRQGSGERRPIDVNALVEESLNLAYHGARAENQNFNIMVEQSFDPAAGKADLFPQEITRVLLNLISNGVYATAKKAQANGESYKPTLAASTKNLGDRVEIKIRDNGTGIPPEIKDKMFNPFFTTKPAGEGTGLGLSISHDIVVKQHGGSIEIDTQPGEFTEVKIILPRTAASIA
jgi:two-component system NtrC family sensor kinase